MGKILVIEDSACIRKLVTVNLVHDGYHVITAADGTTALTHLYDEASCEDIALIILDYNLPDMSGEQIIQVLSRNKFARNIPVAIMTGEELDKPIQCGNIVTTISKPFRIQSFMDIVHSILEAQNEKTACPCH